VKLHFVRTARCAKPALLLQGSDLADERVVGPRLGDTLRLFERYDVSRCFLYSAEPVELKLTDNGGLP
jgi:hypothetical protein